MEIAEGFAVMISPSSKMGHSQILCESAQNNMPPKQIFLNESVQNQKAEVIVKSNDNSD